jgi:hypothetical protein
MSGMERLMLEAAPEPPDEFSAAEVLRRFDRPRTEWTDDDYRYFGKVRANDMCAEEGSHEQLVRQLMDTVMETRRNQWAHEYVQSEMDRALYGDRSRTWLGRLGVRIDRSLSGK